jgi:hypothetical protein
VWTCGRVIRCCIFDLHHQQVGRVLIMPHHDLRHSTTMQWVDGMDPASRRGREMISKPQNCKITALFTASQPHSHHTQRNEMLVLFPPSAAVDYWVEHGTIDNASAQQQASRTCVCDPPPSRTSSLFWDISFSHQVKKRFCCCWKDSDGRR